MSQVNDNLQTTFPNIYAIGDVVPGPMLAHKAFEDGVACVEGISGHKVELNYMKIPLYFGNIYLTLLQCYV